MEDYENNTLRTRSFFILTLYSEDSPNVSKTNIFDGTLEHADQ